MAMGQMWMMSVFFGVEGSEETRQSWRLSSPHGKVSKLVYILVFYCVWVSKRIFGEHHLGPWQSLFFGDPRSVDALMIAGFLCDCIH